MILLKGFAHCYLFGYVSVISFSSDDGAARSLLEPTKKKVYFSLEKPFECIINAHMIIVRRCHGAENRNQMLYIY